MVILLWGECWVFDSKVARCDWDHWEDWVRSTEERVDEVTEADTLYNSPEVRILIA